MSESTSQATGPRTEVGKAKSSMNALKHGLSITRHVILEHENPADFEELCQDVHTIYEPQSARERLVLDDIAQCRWALRRFDRAEAFALELPVRLHSEQQPEVPPQHKLGYMTVLSDQPGREHSEFAGFHNIMRYRGHWDRRHHRALAEFDRAQRARRADAREQRQEREDQRRQQSHDLQCDLLRARIHRELGRTMRHAVRPEEAVPPPDQFVSSPTHTTPPNHGAEGSMM